MTEEEAKTKWCPHALVIAHAGPNTVAANRFGVGSKDYINCKCIASDCAMGCDENGNWLGRCGLIK